MWEEILKTAAGNGLWALLFCFLLMYQLRDSRTRESKYRETIETLTDRLGTLDKVEKGVEETLTILKSNRSEKRIEKLKKSAVVKLNAECAAASEENKVNV